MTSLLKSFKQVPVNAGYFVCIAATSNALQGVDASGNPSSSGQATPVIGTQYMDLGITRRSSGKIYRKVVVVTSPLDVAGAEKFIEIGGAASAFVRMG
jgi:hypothetical protein